jgi:hypothetical protein
MKRFTRRRTGRPVPAGCGLGSSLEGLERRELLSGLTFHPYQPVQYPRTVEHSSPPLSVAHPIGSGARQLSFLDNDGKVITGKDRQGNEYTITVHGPGVAIVSDATPNDGSLDDDIDTIQLVGTDVHRTYVTGQVTSSARVLTDGSVRFNHLIAQSGVASIILNGFTLARTIEPQPDAGFINTTPPVGDRVTEIFLPGGVQFLSFHNIEAPIDEAAGELLQPIDIVIGDPTTELRFEPTIRIDSIFNTVVDPTQTQAEITPGVPQTRPTVNILVNGQLHGLEIVSTTAQPVTTSQGIRTLSLRGLASPPNRDIQARFPNTNIANYPLVSVTGQTSVRALGIDRLKVVGSAKNLTASRGARPFSSGLSGLDHLRNATFGGNADAVALDVSRGPIRRLKFLRGLGNPDGARVEQTQLGFPEVQSGYPRYGLIGGQVAARRIGKIEAGPANLILQTTQDPDFVQQDRTNSTTFYSRPGNALTSAAITTTGSIGDVHIVGNGQYSEIRSGFDLPSDNAGLDPTSEPSHIGRYRQRGDLVDTVVAASYRVGPDGILGTDDDQAGRGAIRGHFNGRLFTNNINGTPGFTTSTPTILRDQGVGFYARRKDGYLPPPERSARVHSVLVRP